MLYDLNASDPINRNADILIIGAGIAGILLAIRLAKEGREVVLLESGSNESEIIESNPLNDIVNYGAYRGATKGRVRCLGGCSSIWGGALIPMREEDMEQYGWPIKFENLKSYIGEVEKIFELGEESYESENKNSIFDKLEESFVARIAKWPSFAKRNLAYLYQSELSTLKNIHIYLNATATDFNVCDQVLSVVSAISPNGNRIQIKPETVIFSAGAIETTRLLLLLDHQNKQCITKVCNALGNYFHDHISTSIGIIYPKKQRKLNHIFGFHFFKNGSMKNIRFELKSLLVKKQSLPPAYIYLTFIEEGNGKFTTLREILRALQAIRLPKITQVFKMVLFLPWLIEVLWWRVWYKKFLYPAGMSIEIFLTIEQSQIFSNKISLSKDHDDIYGYPKAELNWTLSNYDINSFLKISKIFKKDWLSSRVDEIDNVFWHSEQNVEEGLRLSGVDVFHPCGSTRMGLDPIESVVDGNLKMHNIDNIYIASTSVMPNSGSVNPTMMLAAISLRLADYLLAQKN